MLTHHFNPLESFQQQPGITGSGARQVNPSASGLSFQVIFGFSHEVWLLFLDDD